jgi:DNA invertase Pin-like site-specific DNA recombinase
VESVAKIVIFAKFEMLNMKIGYARVSTLEQNLDLQLRALEKGGRKKIFREKVSGSNRERPQFQRMLYQIRRSDTIVVWKLDRLARSTRDLLETIESIREAGGKFQSLSEPWADTTTHAGKMNLSETLYESEQVRGAKQPEREESDSAVLENSV